MAVTLAQPRGQSPAVPIMEKLLIEGGVPLSGTIVPAGNKNAALPLLACSLLTDEEVVLHNVPRIRDVEAMLRAARRPRRQGRAGATSNTVSLQADDASRPRTSTRRSPSASAPRSWPPARCSARFGSRADAAAGRRRDRPPPAGPAPRRLPRPRRDRRARPRHPASCADNGGLQACDFFMDEPSVMGTENALMAAALIDGTTVIRNAASEPHVQDLARMLNKMGCAIEGIGSNVMQVHGMGKLRRLRAHGQPRPHRDRLVHGAGRRHRRRAADRGLRARRHADDPAGLPAPRPAQRARRRRLPRARRPEAASSSATPATTSPRSRTGRGPPSRPTSRASRWRSPPSPRARC